MKVADFILYKQQQTKISMVTCYDYWSAQILDQTDIDVLLVGDSLGMVMHGFKDTLKVNVEMMALHCEAVSKGASNKFIVGDLPFLSYRSELKENINAVSQLMQAGCSAVKLEGCKGNTQLIRHLVDSGVPVMGHLGLTPQSVHQLSGYRVQGQSAEEEKCLLQEAEQLYQAGCFSLVLECVPHTLAKAISQNLQIPTIGIGAGPDVDGQVLVFHDLLGMNNKFKPKFLRRYLEGEDLITQAINKYHCDVRGQEFPTLKESYLP